MGSDDMTTFVPRTGCQPQFPGAVLASAKARSDTADDWGKGSESGQRFAVLSLASDWYSSHLTGLRLWWYDSRRLWGI